MSKSIVVEDWTLDECRNRAARHLGVPPEKLAVRVIRKAKRGVFTSKPYRISATVSDNGSSPGEKSGLLSKLDAHVQIALIEMERIDILSGGEKGKTFNEILASYEKLNEERRREVLELSKLLSGPSARKVQERVAKNGWFTLSISEDQLAAFMEVRPPEGVGRPVTMRDVLRRMREMDISQGIDHVKVRKMLQEVVELGRPIKDLQVAEGRPAQAGTDGRVDFPAEPSFKEEVVRKDGSVDHRGQARITVVHQDQVLARLVAHTEGEPGVTVCGQAIEPRAGRPAQLAAGENVVFDPESSEFRAEIDGVLELSEGTIYVRPTYVVSGDVDMTTGNIEFNGTVQIMGSVRDGFSVRATEDVDIRGGVEGCEIVSEKGSVRIRQGVAGRHRCFVSAGKDVEAKYIENARVYARNDVNVGVAIMHSEVVAGNSVLATSGKGAIIGGTTKAGSGVQALTLGAPNEPVTQFLVGIGLKDQDRIREMDQRLVTLKNAAVRLEEVTREFEHATRNVEALPPRDKGQYIDLRKKLVVVHCGIDAAEARRKEFVEEVTAQTEGTVRATREVFGKVVVRIGQFIDRVETLLHGACFQADPEQGCIIRAR